MDATCKKITNFTSLSPTLIYPCLFFYFNIFIQYVHVSKTIIYPSQNMQKAAVLTKLQLVFQAVHTY